MLSTDQKGAIAGTAIIHAAITLGIDVYKPIASGCRCAEVDRCFFLPFDRFGGRSTIQLRLSPARNDQTSGINWANDFDFAATLPIHSLGP